MTCAKSPGPTRRTPGLNAVCEQVFRRFPVALSLALLARRINHCVRLYHRGPPQRLWFNCRVLFSAIGLIVLPFGVGTALRRRLNPSD